ncbi:MAG: NEW3 domain-containing protein, partial [Bacillota bacterium]|nr:NEW3 domain-containing protein [Bacillota bacterium]
LNLKTPDDVLSTDIYAGGERRLTLQVENTGSAPLQRVRLSSQTPVGWSVTFDPDIIDALAPGETRDVTATIRASEKAITGDYVVAMTASTPETESSAAFRVTVKTRLIWGVVAVGIILLVAAGLSWLIQKYGRR